MTAFLVRRLLHMLAVIGVTVTLGFALVQLAPGDAFSGDPTRAGRSAETIARLRAARGLDQPLANQYARYITQAFKGDLGTSYVDAQPVTRVIGSALGRSLLLSGAGLLAAILTGLLVGSAQGWRPESRFFRAAGRLLTALYAVPEFVVAIALIALLAYGGGWFPVGGMNDPVVRAIGSPMERWLDTLHHLCLPALTLAIGWGAIVARQQRAVVAETVGLSFVRTARAKGLGELRVLVRHVLVPAASPVIAVVGLMLPMLVGGAAVVEVVFAWPGMGVLVLRAVEQRDVPVVSGAIIVIAAVVAASSLLIDLVVMLVDPRQRAAVQQAA